MSCFRIAAAISCVCVAHSDPNFPPGVGDGTKKISDIAKSVPMSDKNQTELLERIKKHGEQVLEKHLVDEAIKFDLEEAAYIAVRQRLVKLIHVGGCPRDMSGCPSEWVETPGHMCEPPPNYVGRCGTTDLSKYSSSAKEEFAWKCRASWPCAASCERDFDGCPQDWDNFDGLCIAPLSYDGMCSPAMVFKTFSTTKKGEWAATCGSSWPCIGDAKQKQSVSESIVNGPLRNGIIVDASRKQ